MRFNNFWTYKRILFSKGFASALWYSRQNLIADQQGRPLTAGPYMAELDITYQCNCRCRMCQRWKDRRTNELSLDEYQQLAVTLHEMGTHQISIAGGEPLLREDVFSIIKSFSGLGMSVNLCTNGILLEKYEDEICGSGLTCITVSLDGASAKTHDEMRAMPGSFEQIEEGIQRLLRHGQSSRPILRVRMTISNSNSREIRAFYEKWHHVVDDVLLQPVHHCNDAFYTGMDESELYLDPEVIAEQIADTPLAKSGYMSSLIESLKFRNSFPHHQCYAGVMMARIDPWGNVYPCLEQHSRVGSIREKNFRTIWNSEVLNHERKRLAKHRTCRCWYNNTALIGHYGSLLEKTRIKLLWNLVRYNVTCHVPAILSGKNLKNR
jgi:MoaA/NifB/PqqE/SkfB family radical SAM enzyme